MHWAEIALYVVAVVAVLGRAAWLVAERLDRLHRKVCASRIALDAQLERRAGWASELAHSSLLDPASAILLADAGHSVLDQQGPVVDPAQALSMAGLGTERERLESNLSATARHALDDPDAVAQLRADPAGGELLENLRASWYRAQIARRFHNEAVQQAIRARRHWYVRWFHLAGRAPLPQTVELDDAMPDTLAG